MSISYKNFQEIFKRVQGLLNEIDVLKPQVWQETDPEKIKSFTKDIGKKTQDVVDFLSEVETKKKLEEFFDEWKSRKDLNDLEKAEIRNNYRLFCHYGYLDSDIAKRFQQNVALVNLRWEDYEQHSDDPSKKWALQKKDLSEILSLRREMLGPVARAMGCSLSEAALDFWNPHFRNDHVDGWIQSLEALKPLVLRHYQGGHDEALEELIVDEADSQALLDMFTDIRDVLLEKAGWTKDRLVEEGITVHPIVFGANGYCWGDPKNMRMCVEFANANLLPATGNLVHETGHLLYMLSCNNAPEGIRGTPTGHINGYAMHEVCAMTLEQVSLKKEFSEQFAALLPLYLKNSAFSKNGLLKPEWSSENIQRVFTSQDRSNTEWGASEISLIPNMVWRTMAERRLMDGDLDLDDLPEDWAKTMTDWTGITHKPEDFFIGESHWFDDNLGYFWAYQIGAMVGASMNQSVRDQQDLFDRTSVVSGIKHDFTDVSKNKERVLDGIAEVFKPVIEALERDVYQKLSIFTPDEIIHNTAPNAANHYKIYVADLISSGQVFQASVPQAQSLPSAP